VAHLDITERLPAETLRRALNDALPADIHVLSVTPVSHRFHARHDAIERTYLYQISRRRTAFGKPFVWWVRDPLDVGRMREAAALFVGMKDFVPSPMTIREKSTDVLIDRVAVDEEDDRCSDRDHFLWKMVRRIVGVLAAVGRGEMNDARTWRVSQRALEHAGAYRPASGLFLERVWPGRAARV
jgi:tRNA pseudouridine38-40 synthase